MMPEAKDQQYIREAEFLHPPEHSHLQPGPRLKYSHDHLVVEPSQDLVGRIGSLPYSRRRRWQPMLFKGNAYRLHFPRRKGQQRSEIEKWPVALEVCCSDLPGDELSSMARLRSRVRRGGGLLSRSGTRQTDDSIARSGTASPRRRDGHE